jgi:hypothetical protein
MKTYQFNLLISFRFTQILFKQIKKQSINLKIIINK